MQIITSHTNADFDTLASMVAVKKLYPQARLVFSGSIEKPLRDMLSTIALPIVFEKVKDVDLTGVDLVILVDVNSPGRLGPFDEVVKRQGIDVHIYDHHPILPETLNASIAVIKPLGSSATVLTLILKEKKIALSASEATIILCGIYEDTGTLSFPSTTTEDFEAAGFLLSCGADLTEVSRLLKKELTPQEVALLDEFLHAETTYNFGGVDIVISEGYLEDYRGDIAIIAHKIMDIEDCKCLFLLANSHDRVYVVGRSRSDLVDVGEVTRAIGGGGHSHAASASLKNMTLIQAKEALLSALRANIIPTRRAADIMSHPPITVPQSMTVADAALLMRRYNINAAPIADAGAFKGIITRQVADKAVFHGLGNTQAGTYMTIECESVSIDTPVEVIREKVVSHGARLLPVLKGKKIVGVITRTDLLKLLQEGLGKDYAQSKKTRFLGKHMSERLPSWAYKLLTDAGECAEALGVKVYAVGGFVRDLLLNRDNLDIDLVVENGDGVAFATELAKRRGVTVKSHPRFKTAVVSFPDGFKLDVATARLEYYERPGALPTIEQSSLKLDLYRRDFIINTLAISLSPGSFGALVDFFGGQKDIKDKTIRVLHNLSFVEDPVRMMRSVRFAEKFGFTIGKHTANLLKNSVKLDLLKHSPGVRVVDELKNILSEETANKTIASLAEYGILGLIHRSISWNAQGEALFMRAKETLAWHELLYTGENTEGWVVLFLALTDGLKEFELKELVGRLSFSGKRALDAVAFRSDALKALNSINAGLVKKNSDICALFKKIPIEVLLYILAKAKKDGTRKTLSLYISKLRNVKTILKGRDLEKLGVHAGPAMGEILNDLLKKRLDNEVESREDELECVRSILALGKKKNKK